MIRIDNNLNDQLHDEIISAVNEEKGIRISALSRRLCRNLMTVKYRVLLMSATKELKIKRDLRSFRVYPRKPINRASNQNVRRSG